MRARELNELSECVHVQRRPHDQHIVGGADAGNRGDVFAELDWKIREKRFIGGQRTSADKIRVAVGVGGRDVLRRDIARSAAFILNDDVLAEIT